MAFNDNGVQKLVCDESGYAAVITDPDLTNGFEFESNEGASFDGPCNGEEDPGMYNGDSMPMYVVSTQTRPQMEEETNFTCGNVVACPLGTNEIYLEIVGPNNQVIPNWYLVLTNTQYSYIRDYIG